LLFKFLTLRERIFKKTKEFEIDLSRPNSRSSSRSA
jgi:hypothetical protein